MAKAGTGASASKKQEQEKEAVQSQEAVQNQQGSLPMQFDVKVNSIRPEDSIKANVSVNINNAFAVTGIKVIEGSKGLFVSMPSYKSANGYRDICFPVTPECRKQLHEAVLSAYEQAITQGQSSVNKHHEMQQQAPEGQTMEMAGQ